MSLPLARAAAAAAALWLSLALGADPALAQGTDTELGVTAAAADDREDDEPRASLFDTGQSRVEGKSFVVVLVAREDLRALLQRHLDIVRFAGEADVSSTELARLIIATPGQARTLVEPEGFFEADVEVEREDPPGALPVVTVRMRHGPQVHIGRLQMLLQGPLLDKVNDGDEASQRRWARYQRRWQLPEGAPFTQRAWTRAKAQLLSDLRSVGYPTANFAGTNALVDVAQRSVRLFVAVDSGPLFKVGQIQVEGLKRTPESAALNVMPFELGSVYREQQVIDYQEALAKVGLYDGIAVELVAEPETADAATMLVRLRERQFQDATLSIGYSTDNGARVGGEYTHRQIFGYDWILSSRVSYGQRERIANFDFLGYPGEGGWRRLFGIYADYLDAGGSITQTRRLRAGRSLDSLRFTRLVFGEFNETAVETDTRRTKDRAIWGNYAWTRRDVNNLLWPTRGTIWTIEGGGGWAYDAESDNGGFARGLGRLTWYHQIRGSWLFQARIEGAYVYARDEQGIPDSLLFRAGGDNSVRGYAFQSLGPQRDGATVGGRVMSTGSLEAMHRLGRSEALRNWYGAVFVDAGDAADSWNGLDPALGYGVGVRWRSPIGPLKLDLAYGEREKSARIHFSVGLSF